MANINPNGLLLVVSGPAGVGKGTINAELMRRHPGIVMSVSATTRAPRPGEIDGVHYFFHTEEEFQDLIQRDALLEYVKVFNMNYYGTPRAFVEENLSSGHDVILEIDVQGALKVRRSFPDAILVFVCPPSMEELKARLVGRATETQEAVERRTAEAYREIRSAAGTYDYAVINDTVESAVKQLEAILSAEKSRVSRNRGLFEELGGGISND